MSADYLSAMTGRPQSWDFIRRFTADWTRPLTDHDGTRERELTEAVQRLGRPLPLAVREAYLLLGRRDDLTSIQDQLLPPHLLEVEDQRWLIYRRENQNCAVWAVDLDDPAETDPPVRWRDKTWTTSAWRPFLDRFSDACVEMVLSETLMTETDLCDNRELDEPTVAALESQYQRLPFPEYEFWAIPDGPRVRWYRGNDVLLRDDSRHWLWVRAQTAAALGHTRRALPGDWLIG